MEARDPRDLVNPEAQDLALGLDRVAFAQALGITPDPWQAELLSSKTERVLLNCSRQSGKSTTCAIIALHRALYYSGSLVLCLAPALRQSQELFGKIIDFYKTLDHPVPAVSERKLSLELTNGSRIVTLPGIERTIRGFSGVSLLLVDEAARTEDELIYALRPMLAVSSGSLIMLTTPYGMRGVFYEEWSEGTGWEKYEVSARDCPRISEEFLAEEEASLPGWVFRQEYLNSFEATEDQVFSEEMIQAAFDDDLETWESPVPMGTNGSRNLYGVDDGDFADRETETKLSTLDMMTQAPASRTRRGA